MRVLIAEGDTQLADEHARQLRIDGHGTSVALTTHAAALRLAEHPDALLLCPLDSTEDTIALLRALRTGEIPHSDAAIPVLVVGADNVADTIRYYHAGADITVPRTSPPLVIAAALDALARRSTGARRSRLVRVGSVTVDRDARTVHVDEQPVHLTRLEFDLLATLASEPGSTFTRAELTRLVWGHDPAAVRVSRTIDSTAHRLRRKLHEAGAEPAPHTIRGVGWRLGS